MTIEQQDAPVPTGSFQQDFDAFYSAELRPVVGLAYVLSGSRTGADDLAQDAFVKAYKHWDRISTYDNPGAWVRRVVANQAVSRIRRRAAEAKALLRVKGSAYNVPELSPDVVAVWGAVRELPQRQAQTVALRYYDRRSISEIARILDCTENTVKTHLLRAKSTLKAALDQGDHDEHH